MRQLLGQSVWQPNQYDWLVYGGLMNLTCTLEMGGGGDSSDIQWPSNTLLLLTIIFRQGKVRLSFCSVSQKVSHIYSFVSFTCSLCTIGCKKFALRPIVCDLVKRRWQLQAEGKHKWLFSIKCYIMLWRGGCLLVIKGHLKLRKAAVEEALRSQVKPITPVDCYR